MAINPAISLGVRPPQTIDPLAIAMGFEQLRQSREASAALAEQRRVMADEHRLKTERLQRAQADQDALSEAFRQGRGIEAIEQYLITNNRGHLVPAVRKTLGDADEAMTKAKTAKLALEEAQADYLGSLAAGVEPFLDDPDQGQGAAEIAFARAKADGLEDSEGLLDRIRQNPAGLRQLVTALKNASPKYKKLALDEQQRAATDRQREETERHNRAMEANQGETAERQEARDKEIARHNQAIERLTASRPAASVVIQTAEGPQLLDKRTATTRPITGPAGDVVPQAPTADMRNKAEGRRLAMKSVAAVKAISDRVITKVGPTQRAEAIKRGAEAVFGTDPEFRTYQDARMALAGNLAVAQQGARPSDADIKAIWLPLVPDGYRDTSESAAMKWKLIDTMTAGEGSATAPERGGADPIGIR